MDSTDDQLMGECLELLNDLLVCGGWYESALEIDVYKLGGKFSGPELESRIDKMASRIALRCTDHES